MFFCVWNVQLGIRRSELVSCFTLHIFLHQVQQHQTWIVVKKAGHVPDSMQEIATRHARECHTQMHPITYLEKPTFYKEAYFLLGMGLRLCGYSCRFTDNNNSFDRVSHPSCELWKSQLTRASLVTGCGLFAPCSKCCRIAADPSFPTVPCSSKTDKERVRYGNLSTHMCRARAYQVR